MIKFLVIYHMSEAAVAKHKAMSPEDTKTMVAPWMAWKDRCGDGLVDMGAGVGRQHVVSNSGSVEKSDDVGGYSFLQAENLDGAKALLANHPMLFDNDGSTISLYEVKSM